MNMSVPKNFSLPQEGTGLYEAGESLRATARKPFESGGGQRYRCVAGEGPETGGVVVEVGRGGVKVAPEESGVVDVPEEGGEVEMPVESGEVSLPRRGEVEEVVPFIGGKKASQPKKGGALLKSAQVVLERLDLAEVASMISGRSRSCSASSRGRFWADSESEADSVMSVGSTSANAKEEGRALFRKDRKRRRGREGNSGSSDEEEGKQKPAKRSQGPTSAPGDKTDLAAAKKSLNEAKREERRLRAQEEVADITTAIHSRASSRLSDGSLDYRPGEPLVSD